MSNKSKRILEMEKLVKKEAINLRKSATNKERSRLNFNTLSPKNKFECIYGQMTGHCDSSRAVKLIKKCAKKVYQTHISTDEYMQDVPLNGSPVKEQRPFYWSPIEVFIVQPNNYENNEKLVDFIKGKVDTLEFI